MQDRELYRRILGVESPCFVERADLKLANGEVHIYLEHEDIRHWACPECGREDAEEGRETDMVCVAVPG